MRRVEPREAWTLADRVLIGASVVALAALLLSASILVVAVALEGWSAIRSTPPRTVPIDATVEFPDLDRLEVRLVRSALITAWWEETAKLHREAVELELERAEWHAEGGQDVTTWPGREGGQVADAATTRREVR